MSLIRTLTTVAVLALGVSTACGGVTTVARSERAAVGWGGWGILRADYCLEPINSADQAGGPLILGSDASAGQNLRSAHGREIAEIMLFARESLYRICEALQNGDLKPAQAAAERRLVFALAAELIKNANEHEVRVLQTIEQAAPPGPPPRTR